jgi:AraC-like DNA-binding protein
MAQVKLSYQLDMTKDSVWLTATPSQQAKASIAYVQELGDFITGRNYFTRRENLPSYLIKYTISGEGILEYDGRSYTVKPGQVFWIDCMKPQYYHTSPRKGEWRIIWVHFYGPTCEAYYNIFMAQNDGSSMINVDSDVAIKSALDALVSLYKGGDSNLVTDVQASGYLTSIMMRCITAAASRKDHASLPDFVVDARSYINFHYTERITLDDLSHALSVNKYYLQKLFKRHMGISPNEYIIQMRLTRAKQLLRTTRLPVSQVSMDVGISNIGHFINLFKSHEGITPGSYRQRWYQGCEAEEPDNKIV